MSGIEERPIIDQLTGALRFIMAFYEPGQRYLDTNAWTQAEAGGRRALERGEAAIAAGLSFEALVDERDRLANAVQLALDYLEGGNPLHSSGAHKNMDLRAQLRAALSQEPAK